MTDSFSYQEICFDAMEVVKEAAAYVRDRHEQRRDLIIEEKGKQNFVTEVDKKAEQILISGLSSLLPDSGFIAEEGTSSRRGGTFNWVIDPVDGTTNFIHGVFPLWIFAAKIICNSPGNMRIRSRIGSLSSAKALMILILWK